MEKKLLSDLSIKDISKHAVWVMVEDERSRDVLVRPINKLPVETLSNRLAATKVRLADGSTLWALLGNVSPGNSQATKHFLTVSIEPEGRWFDLARYHDADYAMRDGRALAKWLGKRLADVFPMEYDISELVIGPHDSLVGAIESTPNERLMNSELMRLASHPD